MGNINANNTVMGNRSTESVTYRGKQVTIPSLDAVAAYRQMLRQKLAERARNRGEKISADINAKGVASDVPAILFIDALVSAESVPSDDLFLSADAQEMGIALPLDASLYNQKHQGVQENLLSILRTADRLLVLGEPGAGKTVALERLAWELCLGQEPVIPVTISLADYDGTPLAKCIWSELQKEDHLQLKSPHALAAFLETSPARCFFLFDDLNEVAAPYQGTLVNELIRLMAGCPQHAVICASRPQGNIWQQLSSGMQTVVIQPISEEQAESYREQVIDYIEAYTKAYTSCTNMAALRADQILKPEERIEAGRALAKIGDPRFRTDAGFLPNEPMLGFVEIPEGAFLMGSDPNNDDVACDDEQPYHRVRLPRYYMARYPVTVAQFQTFMKAGGYQEPHYWKEAQAAGVWNKSGIQGRQDDSPRREPVEYGESYELANCPVVGITWYEALAYCRWLTKQLHVWKGTPEPLASLLREERWEVQLPSEAEWEKAARGTDGRIYPWGNGKIDPNRTNFNVASMAYRAASYQGDYDLAGDELPDAVPVGCFPGGASPYGIEDLSGNVWEWTRSHSRDYPYHPWDGREVLEAGPNVFRVLRGGTLGIDEGFPRCARRNGCDPLALDYIGGFRVVLSPHF